MGGSMGGEWKRGVRKRFEDLSLYLSLNGPLSFSHLISHFGPLYR